MKLAILFLLLGLENPFFGNIQSSGPVCPSATVALQIPARNGEMYQWEWRPSTDRPWQAYQLPIALSGTELLKIDWPTHQLPAEIRVKSWRNDSVWYSAPFFLDKPVQLQPLVQGSLRVCLGQDARLRVDFPPNGSFQWERWNQDRFIPVGETAKFTRTQQAEMIIRGTAGIDDQSLFRCRWTSPEGCVHYSQTSMVNVNQLSTISPVPSTLICENQPQVLRTAGIQGEWIRNDWFLSNSQGVLVQQTDSTARTYTVGAWPLFLRNVQVRATFKAFQRVGLDTLSSTCTLTTTRTYTVSPAPASRQDSLVAQCGFAPISIDPKGGDWSISNVGPWSTSMGTIQVNEPDTVTRWYRVRGANGCPSAPYALTVHVLPVPRGTLVWEKNFLCSADSLLPIRELPVDSAQLWFQVKGEPSFTQKSPLPTRSNWIFWRWEIKKTGCKSTIDSVYLTKIPPLRFEINIPEQPVCPGQVIRFQGFSTDSNTLWTWLGPGPPQMGSQVDYQFTQHQTGRVQVKNACEVQEQAWQIQVEPEVTMTLISPRHQQACLGDSTKWEAHFSSPVQVTWYAQGLGEVGTGATWTALANRVGVHKVWFRWTDRCGRTQQSDTLTWQIHSLPEMPRVADTLKLCLGELLPTPSGPDLWIWSNSAVGQTSGESDVFVQAQNTFGCTSSPKVVFVGVSPRFDFKLVQTQTWLCASGLRNRRVFVQNPSGYPVRWLTSGAQDFEAGGWFFDQPGQFVVAQERGWCTQRDTLQIESKSVSPWVETPPSSVFYCPTSDPILSLPKEEESALFWYETSLQEVPIFNGNTLIRTSRTPVWVRKREGVVGDLFCESDPIRITPTPILSVQSKIRVQERCRGNTATFEVETLGNGSGQWFQKKPTDGAFFPIPNATSSVLRLTNIGSTTHPDQSLYRFEWKSDSCQAVSEEMRLTVMGFVQTLSSQEVCAGSPFPLPVPQVQGTMVSPEWQTRPGTSGTWISQSPPNQVEVGSQYWRIRGQFRMENGQTCIQTSDDARVQVHSARGVLTVLPDSCPGQASHFTWTPQLSNGTIFWNGTESDRTSGRLASGQYTFQYQVKNCTWDTTFTIIQSNHVLEKPILPDFARYFLGDSASLLATVQRADLHWFADSLGATQVDKPVLNQVGPFTWYASYFERGCHGPIAAWRGEIIQPLRVLTPKTYVHQCAGLSIDMAVEALGQGQLTFQWYQSVDSSGGWTPLLPWSSRHRGEQSAILRLYSVGSFPHLDLGWYRCLIRDEQGERWGAPIQLETWLARGSLLPHQYVCEGSSPTIDIRSFRGWQNNESGAYWEQRTAQGWVFWKEGYQLPLHEQPEAEYRYAWEFQNSDQETCKHVSDSFRIQKVAKPAPPSEASWSFCQDERTIPLPLSGSQFSWYESPEQSRITSTSTPRISLHEAKDMTWWLARKGTYCESDRLPVRLTIHPRAEMPVSTTPKELIGYLLEFSAQGEQLKWYRTTRSASQMEPPKFSQPGLHRFYVTQTNTWGCESPQRLIESRLSWPARIAQQPQHLFECQGNLVTFQIRMEGAGNFQFQWFHAPAKGQFKPVVGANGQDLRISSAGSTDFPDSSRFFCSVQWGDGFQVNSDTVSLWINSVSNRPLVRTICPDDTLALAPQMAGIKGSIRQLFWEIKNGNQWSSTPGLTWALDSFPSGQSTVRARVVFQSELRETCTRTSGEFIVQVLPKRMDPTLPNRIITCDTALTIPLLSHWQWQKVDTVDQIRSKLDSGCWSGWSTVAWETEVCWADETGCNPSDVEVLSPGWQYFRLPDGLVWANARGEGLIYPLGSVNGNPHWVIQGKGELAAPPHASSTARWLVAPQTLTCQDQALQWEVMSSVATQPAWATDSSVSLSILDLPSLGPFQGVPVVTGSGFTWSGIQATEWQRWDPVQSLWVDTTFPLDTAWLTSTFRYKHWHSPSIFEWVVAPVRNWTDVPAICTFKGMHHFHHNLQFPIQTEVRTLSGQLTQSFVWSTHVDFWPMEQRSMYGPMKMITFTDRWGRTCTVRSWSE